MMRNVGILSLMLFGFQVAFADEKPAKDEAAIRAAVQSYVAAYNRGDAKALADHWSEGGQWVSPSGQRIQGRAAIEKEMRAMFAERKGLKVEVVDPKIRFVSADVAIEEGTARVLRAGEPPEQSTYLAIHVKKDGQWKLDSVRETDLPETPPLQENMKQLEWMVGDWVDQSPEAAVETSVAWTRNKAFLIARFKVSAAGADELDGQQIIGWDPAAKAFRSWMFDCDGGFGEGVWSRRDNRWIVKFNQTLPDGREASATNIYTCVDANSYTWQSIGRQLDGQFLPNVEEVKVVRKAAQPEKPAGKK